MRLRYPALLAIFAAASLLPQDLLSPGVRIAISRAVPLGATDNPLYDVSFSYSFEGRSTAWLQGVGEVPAVGELALTLASDHLVFKAGKNGAVLASIHVEPTEIQQTPPTGSPYASTALAGWQQDGALLVASLPVEQSWSFLERHLREAYGMYVGPTPCRPDDAGCLLTQWTSLSARSETLQVQMAVMIVFSSVAANKTSLKLYYQGRQALIGEKLAWDSSLDEKSRALIAAKLAALRQGLSRKEGN